MDVQVNYWAVLFAAVSSMVVGSIWYLPGVFGDAWAKLTGVKMEDMRGERSSPGKMAWMYGSVFAASLVTAYILAHVTFLSREFFKDEWLNAALSSAFWLWLGFTAARIYVHDTFEMRRKQLTVINCAHELITVLVMAVIIGWLHP